MFTVFSQESFYTEAFAQRCLCTQKLLRAETFSQRSLEHRETTFAQKLWHRENFAQRNFVTDKCLREETLSRNGFTYSSFHTENPLRRPAFTLKETCVLHTDAFAHTHRCLYTEQLWQTLLDKEAVTQSNFYTERLLHTDAFAQRSLSVQTLLHIEVSTHRSFYAQRFSHGSFMTL